MREEGTVVITVPLSVLALGSVAQQDCGALRASHRKRFHPCLQATAQNRRADHTEQELQPAEFSVAKGGSAPAPARVKTQEAHLLSFPLQPRSMTYLPNFITFKVDEALRKRCVKERAAVTARIGMGPGAGSMSWIAPSGA